MATDMKFRQVPDVVYARRISTINLGEPIQGAWFVVRMDKTEIVMSNQDFVERYKPTARAKELFAAAAKDAGVALPEPKQRKPRVKKDGTVAPPKAPSTRKRSETPVLYKFRTDTATVSAFRITNDLLGAEHRGKWLVNQGTLVENADFVRQYLPTAKDNARQMFAQAARDANIVLPEPKQRKPRVKKAEKATAGASA